MSEQKSNKNNARRKLLKSLAAGSGAVIAGRALPDNWSRPVVDSVILPGHAQTSFSSFTGAATNAAIPADSRFARLMNGIINEAQAGAKLIFSAESVCIKSDGEGTVSVDALITQVDDTHSVDVSASNVPVGGGTPSAMSETYCLLVAPVQTGLLDKLGLIRDAHAGGLDGSNITVQVTSIAGNAIGQFLINDSLSIPFDLPPGDCSAPSCPPPIQD